MATGDVYQVVDTMTLFSQKCLNVYYYQMGEPSAGLNDAAAVSASFVDNMLPAITAVQSVQVVHISVRVTNLFDEADVHEELLSVAGEYVLDADSAFSAYGFRLVGSNGAVRAGAKRIPGVVDANMDDGVISDGGLLVFLDDLATQFTATLAFGEADDGALLPVIVKRILTAGHYLLPDNALVATLSNVVDALFNTNITSQVSRKIGRGE